MDGQLVDALVLMANSMKSGLSLMQAVEMAATELKPPIATQFETVLREVQLGRSIDQALVAMTERVPLPDLEIAVHSIVTLRETGGNLSETFMTVANTIVERKKVEGKIGAITAQGLYQGFGMCAMPFILAAVFYLMNPELTSLLFTTPLGWVIWLIVIILDSLGMWAIMKVVKIDV
jgi:tight adherence protein B